MLKRLLLCICIATPAFFAASAQETETPEPANGTHVIEPGFLPDPYIVTVHGGGEENASLMVDGCVGFIAERPDAAFVYESPASGFRIFFISDLDATLMIQEPDGTYLCNDDSVGRDPAIEITPGGVGTYLVWVGSFDSSVNPTGYLMLTEVYETVPGHILTPVMNFITSYIPMEQFTNRETEDSESQ